MNSIHICFCLKAFSNSNDSKEQIDNNYQSVYKLIAKFLYSHPDFAFSFCLSGIQLSHYKKNKKELITIFKTLIERKQIEIIGGGFYNPILPLLYPVDRNGQIDKLTTEIRQTIGKRPRGIYLYNDCWHSSLVNSLETCGIEYALLCSKCIPTKKLNYLPIIMSDLGKSIEIYPKYEDFIPSSNISVKDYINKIIKAVNQKEKKSSLFQMNPDRIICVELTHKKIVELLESKWLEDLYNEINSNLDSKIKLNTISQYKKNCIIRETAYLPVGISNISCENNSNCSIYDYLDENLLSKKLYNRIIYVSNLVNQFKSDKIRKDVAREYLWQAQNGNAFFADRKARQQAYLHLMDAEKTLRDSSNFIESVNCFDYTKSGLYEYVCRMQNYFAYISTLSGAIQDLEILKNTGNYVDNLSREEAFENVNDDYERGIFIDHMFNEEQYNAYLNGNDPKSGIFSKIYYSELKFTNKHFEIQLAAKAKYGKKEQNIYLKKKYIINSTGMFIQYIIKNLSDKPLHSKFVVESNFSHTKFDKNNISYYKVEAVDNNTFVEIDSSKSTSTLKDKLKSVEAVRITDSESGICFGFEANENCEYFYMPLIFNRNENSSLTHVSSLIWDLNIEPNMEIEKNINFTITNVKKEKKKK